MSTDLMATSPQASLRSKLMMLISFGVLVFGSVNLVVVGRLSYAAVIREQQKSLRSTAALLAERAEVPMLHDDRVELDRFVRQCVAINSELGYVLIVDKGGQIEVHSFEGTVPGWLASGRPAEVRNDETFLLTSPDGRQFVDVSAGILNGRLGLVRVGVDLSGARGAVARLLSMLAAMVLLLLLCGLVAACWVAGWVTAPAERIATALDRFRLGGPSVVIGVRTGDELERLADHVAAIMERIDRLHHVEIMRQGELARIERLAAVGTLTAGLAHEINNPLAGIKQAAESLADRPAEAGRVRRYIPVILDAVRRMERILGELLAFARPSARELRAVDPWEVLDLAARLAAPRVKEAGAALSIACEGERRLVRADVDSLAQAVLNLLLNAADAVADAPVREIRVGCRRGEPDVVTIVVEDSGPGVTAENRERIFEPFFTTKAPGKGTGLGLATAWTAVHQMGGTLRIEPSLAGACFAVSLPAWKNGVDGPGTAG